MIEMVATILVVDCVSCCSTCWLHVHFVICEKNTQLDGTFEHIAPQNMCNRGFYHIFYSLPPKKLFCKWHVLNVQKILSYAF